MGAEEKAAARAAEGLVARAIERAGVREAETLVEKIERVAAVKVREAGELAVRDAARRGEARAPKDVLDAMEAEYASRLTASQRERVVAAIERAAANEQVLTPQLKEVAAGSGMTMAGLDFSVKSQGSLERKIGGKLPEDFAGTAVHDATFEHELGRAGDVVRYTMVAPEHEYAAATERAMQGMRERGFVAHEVKDNWTAPTGYRGVNSTWVDPATGQRFEMQFHTPESLAAKESTHPVYDFRRVADDGTAPEFDALQNEVFDLVPIPEETTTRGNPRWLSAGDTS